MNKKTCPICKQQFPPKCHGHKYCTHRCAFIAIKLSRAAGQRMPREEAIAEYGLMYDDPFRHLGRTKYKPLIRAIYNYCQENNTKEFVFSVLPKATQEEFTSRSLSAVAARRGAPIRQTKEKVKNARGTAEVFVWEFTMRL